jgi:hypothetical protein
MEIYGRLLQFQECDNVGCMFDGQVENSVTKTLKYPLIAKILDK